MLNQNHMCQIAVHSGHWLIARDGKVRFGPVLQGLFKNPELDHQFGSWILANLKLDHRFGLKRSGSGSPAL